jgi:hypothetical protein
MREATTTTTRDHRHGIIRERECLLFTCVQNCLFRNGGRHVGGIARDALTV